MGTVLVSWKLLEVARAIKGTNRVTKIVEGPDSVKSYIDDINSGATQKTPEEVFIEATRLKKSS